MHLARARTRALIATATLASVLAPAAINATSAHAAGCTVADPTFAGPPAASDAGRVGGVVSPLRNDPDGFATITLAVEDPAGGTYRYTDAGNGIAVYSHRWPGAANLVTFGYANTGAGRVRVPIIVVENPPSGNDDAFAQAMAELARQATPVINNSSPYVLNTIAPTGIGVATVVLLGAVLGSGAVALSPGAGPSASAQVAQAGAELFAAWLGQGNGYPATTEYSNHPPTYLWTAYRTAPGAQLWSGFVIANNGSVTNSGRQACRRVRVGSVVRTQDSTTFVAGAFVQDDVRGSSANNTFNADETIVVGATTAANGTFVDVPLARVQQHEHKQGAVVYPAQQQDTIAIGADGPAGFVPLLGVRSDATHAAPPDAQHHTVALGVFDPLGAFHPLVGAQTNFEKLPSDLWLVVAALGELGGGGIADPSLGDWNASVGAFDPAGSYTPAAGIAYASNFSGARDHARMMITAGPFVAGAYTPVLAATYDGTAPLNILSTSRVGRFLVSAGVITPVGYVPAVGASYERPNHSGVEEQYRVGVFSGHYPDFVPLLGANWYSNQPSYAWANAFAMGGRAPSDANVDIGPVVPTAGFTPVIGGRVKAGSTEREGVGVWAMGGFIPLLEACRGANGRVGVGAGPNHTPVAWVNPSGGPAGLGDC